jgi:integrase
MVKRRRLSGEGGIWQRADGRYCGSVELGWDGDGRRRRYVYGKTKTEVADKLAVLRRQGVRSSRRPPTVAEWLEQWLETTAARRVRPMTLRRYRSLVRTHMIPRFGRVRLDRLTAEQIEAAWADMAERGSAAATVLQAHRVLARALYVAEQRRHIGANPARLVDAPTVARDEVEPYTREQARKLLAAARGQRNAARWSVALAIGLRQGEALGLRWSDVDLDTGMLTVRTALQRIKGQGLQLVGLKSKAAERAILLPSSLLAELKAHRAEQLAERIQAGSAWADLNLVFAQPLGRPIDPRRDWQAWRDLIAAAKVPVRRLHDARHTAATLMLLQGVDVRVVQQILGHSSSTLTRDTYQHVVPEIAADAAARIEGGLWGAEKRAR